MKDVIKIRITVKPQTKEKSFEFYYNSENSFLYSMCFITQNKKRINPYDTDARFENGIYYLDYYFKMHPASKPPKLSFGLRIFYENKEIESKINILKVEVFDQNGNTLFSQK